MSEIKIFVSHRIDIESELINSPIYVPVRCGAVYDKINPMHIAGDDIGDHISHKRMTYCEFTVQYWAWKNVKADYYGLCHYRRYLSFTDRRFKTDVYNMIYDPVLTPSAKTRYGLLNSTAMEQLINRYDIVVSEAAEVRKIPTPVGYVSTVRQLWDAQDGVFLEISTLELMLKLIDGLAPEYSLSARNYLESGRHRGFNCYVLRRELFERLCAFQFPIMAEIERQVDTTGYGQTMMRTPAFIGEILYGIFIDHVIHWEQWRVKELQLVFFRDTEKIRGRMDLVKRCLWSGLDRVLRVIVDPLLPKGSRRREAVKHIFYYITHAKQRGVANIQ